MKLSPLNSPGLRFSFVFVVGFLVLAFALETMLQHRVWPATFEAGDVVESSRGRFEIEERDLRSEPGEIESHAEFNEFFGRQGRWSDVASESSLRLTKKDGTQSTVTAQERALGEIPALFWIQVVVGLGALLISGWIWALRSKNLAIAWFALSGLSILVSAVPSAIYTSREMALPQDLFRVLESLNAIGAIGFGIAMLGLFSVYPVRLPHWKIWSIAQALFFSAWLILYHVQLTPGAAGVSLMIVTEMAAICVVIGLQFWATKGRPADRAALTWLGLSVILGAGAFVVFNTLPLVLGLPSLNQGYAFAFFLIIYLGLAAGLTRYRLFEVGQWAFRFLFYALGALILVLLDAALVFGLGVDRLPALGAALLVAGFLYLPLRDGIWRAFSRRGRLEPHELLASALHVAFAPSAAERTSRWEALLQRLFDPLEITSAPAGVREVEILTDGLTLEIPAVAGAPALRLSYPWSGRSLYTPQSREVARQIVTLIAQADSNREAYDRGVTEERRRMAQDLHDDVGARLLTGLTLADERLRPTLQGAIADIRSIVRGMTGEQVVVARLLEDVRHETSRRLEPANIGLVWSLKAGFENRALDYRQHKTLGSALREVVSNVIRHSGARELAVEIKEEGELLILSLRDDGRGVSPEAVRGETQGYGLRSLRRRLHDLGGTCELRALEKGSEVVLILPYALK